MPVNPSSLVSIIEKNKNKKLLASKIIEANPQAVSVLPKLIADNRLAKTVSNPDSKLNINRSILETIYHRVKNIRQNNKNIIRLFPDIELAIQILVSSILSPKKMTDIQLNYKLDKNFSINTVSVANIIEKIKTYINDEYEIEEKLPEILRESLFNSGAYVLAIIPESSVDEIINTDLLPSYSTEDFKQRVDILVSNLVKPINILNTQDRSVALESTIKPNAQNLAKYMASEEFINITDNVNILKFSSIREKINKSIIRNSIKNNIAISAESREKLDYMDIFRQRNLSQSYKNIEFVKTKKETKRKSIGKPMVFKIPTEAVIPVFIPGDETEHIGYFVLLDETGKPLNTDTVETNISNINYFIAQSTQPNQLSPVQKAYYSLINDSTSNIDVNQLFDLYKNILENQIYQSIKNSIYGPNVKIANKNDIYFLMFTRALSGQKTSILYIPRDLVIYFAFYYNEFGLGKSLLENLSILCSLRAILLFSKVMAYAKQSIDVTKVNITLDPNDPDPEKTIEQVQDSVLKLRQNYFPLGINNPVDLVNWIQRAGLQFSYSNNPLLPNIQIDFENANLQHTIPDSELEEELRKQTIIALGLSPETIDSGFTPEFATTVVNNNILLSKRVSIYQKTLIKHLSHFLSIVLYNDEDLRNKIRKEIIENIDTLSSQLGEEEKQLLTTNKDNFVEYFLNKLSESLYIDLPKPENTNLANLSVEYDIYKDNLEKVIDSVFSSEIFTEEISGEISNSIETIKSIYKHHLLRTWMANNNFYPEVLEFSKQSSEITNTDKLIEIINEYLVSTSENSAKLVNLLKSNKEKLEKKYSENSSDKTSSDSEEESSPEV